MRLALDLAGRTGYAIRFGDGRVKTGVLNLARGCLEGKRNPLPMVRLYRRLCLLSRCEIEKVIFEETFARGSAKYRLDSLQHAVVLWAVSNGVVWRRVSPKQWKKAMLGDARASKREYSEAAIEAFPGERFWTDDQCAARWLLEFDRRLGGNDED